MKKITIGIAILNVIVLFLASGKVAAQNSLDTTMVDIAYGKQAEWKRTSAISTIYGEDLLKTTSPSIGNSLHGRIPGLTILQQSGEPGYDFNISNIYARGQSSYMGNQNILVFVDGFEAPLDRLTATEIESISFLKDASALALYGMRGANGVLLVTTKKGMVSAPQINIRLQTGIQRPTFFSNPINAYDYARLYNQARTNDGLAPVYSQSDIESYKNGNDPYFYPNVNWKEQIIRDSAPLSLAELSFRGGSSIAKYYVMMNLLQNSGFYNGTDNKRKENSNAYYASFNFRSNLDIEVNKNLLASLYFSGSVGDHSIPGGGNSAYNIISSIWATPPNAFPVYNPDGSYGGNNNFTNPVGNILSRGLYKENSRTFQVISNLKYDLSNLIKGLSATAGVAYNNFVADSSPKTSNYARYALSRNSEDEIVYTQYGTDAPLEAAEGFRTDWSRSNLKMQVDYSRLFGDHGIDINTLALSDIYSVYNVRHDMKYLNFAGRFTYTYQRKYIAELSMAYTGTDNFAPGKRFGLFPAVSAGWIISNEDFIKDNDLINYLKLRASYGTVGNDMMGAERFLFDQTYSGKGSYLFGTGSSASGGFGSDMLSNYNIAWEKKNTMNIGVDAILSNHLSIVIDYFNEQRKDILAQPYATVPGFLGASWGNLLPYMNVGKVQNQGFELIVRYDRNVENEFKYFVEPSVWYARNKIVNRDEEVKLFDYLYQRGHPVGKPFVLVADGLYQENDFDADGNLNGSLPVPQFGSVKPGDIKYVDQNEDGVIDSNDVFPVGYSNVPEWNYALGLGLTWKRFDMEALLHGVANRDIFLNGPSVYSFTNNGTASELALNSWTPENTSADYPRLSTTSFDHNYRRSTFWKRNGSYLRIKNIQIGYTLPTSVSNTLKLSNIYIYTNGVNLLTINGIDGIADPEPSGLLTYPLAKSYNVGLKIDF